MCYNIGTTKSEIPEARYTLQGLLIKGKLGFPMTSSNLTPFDFEGNEFRVMTGEDGEPRFVAADVCKALAIVNVGNALARLDVDEKDDIRLPDVTGRMQQTATVTESGLYSLVLRSDKPEAKRFKRWIAHDVLPSIRKTGSYSQVALSPAEQILSIAQHMVDLEHRERERDASIKRIEARIDAADQKGQFFTVRAYGRVINRHFDDVTHQKLSTKCRTYSINHGLFIGKVMDAKYGELKSYHEDCLKAVFADFYGQWPLLED